jgi:hypothetical protein
MADVTVFETLFVSGLEGDDVGIEDWQFLLLDASIKHNTLVPLENPGSVSEMRKLERDQHLYPQKVVVTWLKSVLCLSSIVPIQMVM